MHVEQAPVRHSRSLYRRIIYVEDRCSNVCNIYMWRIAPLVMQIAVFREVPWIHIALIDSIPSFSIIHSFWLTLDSALPAP